MTKRFKGSSSGALGESLQRQQRQVTPQLNAAQHIKEVLEVAANQSAMYISHDVPMAASTSNAKQPTPHNQANNMRNSTYLHMSDTPITMVKQKTTGTVKTNKNYKKGTTTSDSKQRRQQETASSSNRLESTPPTAVDNKCKKIERTNVP